MAWKPNYRFTPIAAETLLELASNGLSRTRIARLLHIAPVRFKERVAACNDLQRALDAGYAIFQNNKIITPKPVVKKQDAEDDFDSTPKMQPIDAIILNAIEAGTVDRPSLERTLNPQRRRDIQITPSLERLFQYGKIKHAAPQPGVMITKYAAVLTVNGE